MMQSNKLEDEIMIPKGNGFITIPVNGLREQVPTLEVKRTQGSLGLFVMKIKNILQFMVILSGMAGIMAYIGYTISGMFGVVTAFVASGIGFFLTSNYSIERALRRKNVRFIHPYEGGVLYDMIRQLAGKAGIEKPPILFFDESSEINAFTVEDKHQAAIVISRGIINHLTQQELNGVLAHEIAHLKNNDVRLMLFSEQLRRLTGYMALFGQFLLILNLPFLLLNQIVIPWVTIILLITAPMLSLLFQVAMSRNREFKADMDAVILAGDTKGLTKALKKINMQSAAWRKFYAPFIKEVPEILRTHPDTAARIRRLGEMEAKRKQELGWSQ